MPLAYDHAAEPAGDPFATGQHAEIIDQSPDTQLEPLRLLPAGVPQHIHVAVQSRRATQVIWIAVPWWMKAA